jgi:hypothetical protein
MYTIYWMNKHNKDWTEDVIYIDKQDAVDILVGQGYTFVGGWYKRKELGWEGDTRAMICPMKVYKKQSIKEVK